MNSLSGAEDKLAWLSILFTFSLRLIEYSLNYLVNYPQNLLKAPICEIVCFEMLDISDPVGMYLSHADNRNLLSFQNS